MSVAPALAPDPLLDDGTEVLPRDADLHLKLGEEGWFPRDARAFEAPWTRASFERRAYRVRPASFEDLSSLVALEAQCWPAALCQSAASLRRRIEDYPRGQLVVELDGAVVAAVWSQGIEDDGALLRETMDTVEALRRSGAPILQLLAINVLPEVQDRGLGDALLEHVLQRASLLPEIRKVVGVTRCKDHGKHAGVPMESYVRLRTDRGTLIDTTLRFHENHGATIKQVISSYRCRDEQNCGAGVLVEYDLRGRRSATSKPVPPAVAPASPRNVADIVEAKVRAVLGEPRAEAYASERPFMEMGLDSGDLLELNETLGAALAVKLQPSVFFEHNTPRRITEHLSGAAHLVRPSARAAAMQVTSEVMPIAIVGAACRLPGRIRSADALWEMLLGARDCVGTLPAGRWTWPDDVDPRGEHVGIDRGGFLTELEPLDPSFFRITPREAARIDPQQSVLLELGWECLEDAGYAPSALAGSRTGVFVGASGSDHVRKSDARENVDAQYGLATAMSVLANRVSYFFDLRGPSLVIDTACSSSLVAVHQAVRALRAGDCEQALVAGVHLMLHPALTIAYYRAGMLSKRGRCSAFDAGADGYVRSEGAAMLLLKPLATAVGDGDDVYAVIRGSATSHGGLSGGLTAPNPARQASLIVDAYRDAQVDPRTVGLVEAHGTGTALGDPVEMKGIIDAFATMTEKGDGAGTRRCAIGSIKTNLGHLEAAAGITGLLKAALCLRAGTRVASLHFERLNPQIDLNATGLYVATTTEEWPALEGQRARRASVSSFGSGGTNAHVVLEELVTPSRAEHATDGEPALLVISAHTPAALRRRAASLRSFLTARSAGVELGDVAYTLQVGRQALEHRMAFVARSVAETVETLTVFLADRASLPGVFFGHAREPRDPAAFLDEGAEIRDAVAAWTERRALEPSARAWVRGGAVPWERLHADREPRRLHLPAYPFGSEESAAGAARDACDARVAIVHRPVWASSAAPDYRPVRGRWTIVAPAACTVLARRLAARLVGAERVEIRTAFEPAGADRGVTGVVDLSGCAPADAMALEWIAPLQAWIREMPSSGARWMAVTRGLADGTGGPAALSGATRAALARMLGAEYGSLRSQHLDLAPDGDDDDDAATIAAELSAAAVDTDIRYRRGERQTPTLEPLSPRPASSLRPFPANATLLVTGGTRGLGRLCAHHLVARFGVRRVLLAGREALPPRAKWPALAGDDSALGAKVRGLLDVERAGAEVATAAVDLTDARAVEHLVASCAPIGGVLHAAGRADWETLAFVAKTLEGMRAILEPKVRGVHNLYAAVKREPLRFFVLFSSVAATLPVLATGQSDYSMANAYLDYFAQAHQAAFPLVSVQWPSWKETGMGEVKSHAYLDTGLLSCTDGEGLALLNDILAHEGADRVLLPAVVDPARWRPASALQCPAPRAPRSRMEARDPGGVSGVEAQKSASAIEGWLFDVFSEELGLDRARLDPEMELQDYGVDSILLAQVLKRINRDLQDDLSPTLLYEHPTLRGLAGAIAARPAATAAPVPSPSPVRALPASASAASDRPSGSEAFDAPRLAPFSDDAIVIVGLSCRFAGAPHVDAYWRLLDEGRSAIRAVPPTRWKSAVPRFAGLLDDVPSPDLAALLLSEDDARAMDPQALLLLQESATVFRSAGVTAESLKGSATGVYLGARSDHRAPRDLVDRMRNPIMAFGQNYLAANVSHLWDLRGPSLVVDTACSSALVAMKQASLAIRAGDITQAVVGGVSLLGDERHHELFARRGILSPDAQFHLFDRRARGAVLGEGIGMVLLKRLADALRDGDEIYAVLRAIECNNDGRTAGPAAPNVKAQREVMERALAASGVRAEEVGYVELNGTGSEVTDLLELKATEAVYRRGDSLARCGLGSVKPNVGHTLCAEGMASLLKVVLMLRHGMFVPFLSGSEPPKHHDIASGGFYFSHRAESWPAERRLAAVSCFGDGGTNVHAILEEWRETKPGSARRRSVGPLDPAQGSVPAVHAGAVPASRNRWKRQISDDGQRRS